MGGGEEGRDEALGPEQWESLTAQIVTSDLPLQLVQKEDPERAAQLRGSGQWSASTLRYAVGVPARRSLLDRAVNVVHVAAEVTHLNVCFHPELIVTAEPNLHRLVRRGRPKASHGRLGLVALAAKEVQRGL